MSIATIGAVAATDTELLIPGIPQIPYALLLTGAGGTTEVIEVRSLQRGGHVYVTRGAFGSLPVAHTAPVVVTLYDPNNGGGGGGVTNSAPNHAIAVSDGTNLAGDANLTWNYGMTSGTLGIAAGANDIAEITALGLGSQLILSAGDRADAQVGGEIQILTGSSAGGDSGALTLATGGDSGGGTSGTIFIKTGHTPDGQSGNIEIRTNPDSWKGGSINVVAGAGQGSDGGSIVIQAGSKVTGGSHGSVQLYSGDGSATIELNASGVFLSAVVKAASLPISDPHVAGQLYSDGTPAANTPKALMVSGG